MYKDVTKLSDLIAAIFTTPFFVRHVKAGMDKPRYSISRSAIRDGIPSVQRRRSAAYRSAPLQPNN